MGLNALNMKLASSDFKVLAFPCNNFGLQEPGANYSEILNGIKYVRPGGGFVPNFQMFKKIEVNGKNEDPLYTYLKSKCGPTGDAFEDDSFLFYEPKHVSDVRWNFEVFLISKNGIPLYRYSPDTAISDIEFDVRQLVNHPIVQSNEIPVERTNIEPEPEVEEREEETNAVETDYQFPQDITAGGTS